MLITPNLPSFLRVQNARVRDGKMPEQRIAFLSPRAASSRRVKAHAAPGPFNFTSLSTVPCFVKGNRIQTPNHRVKVEDLNVGDTIVTRDNGPQTIRWIGATEVDIDPGNAPIEFAAGALGNSRVTRLSPSHRVLLTGWRCKKISGADEVFAQAIDLVNGRDITQVTDDKVVYYHLAFDQHEILMADGIPSESFHPGRTLPDQMSGAAFVSLSKLFPEVSINPASYGKHARPDIKPSEARLIRP